MFTRRSCAAGLLLATLACAGRSSSSAGSTGGDVTRKPDVITAAELADPTVISGDALAAVRRLRPTFLMTRGSGSVQNSSAGSVHVSINGAPLQTLDNLSRVRANDVAEIRYINAAAAAQRFGTAAGTGGVILVKTK